MNNLDSSSVIGYHYIRHAPFNVTNFGLFSEIRIAIQSNDVYFPHDSFLSLEGKFDIDPPGTATNPPSGDVINHGFLQAFDSITYLINSSVVDMSRRPGITSTLKSLSTISRSELISLENSGFNGTNAKAASCCFKDGNRFHVLIPLSLIMGFFEDHQKFIAGVSQELVLSRASNDVDAFIAQASTTSIKFDFEKIYWIVPQIKLADHAKSKLYNSISKNMSMPMKFRSWTIHEFPKIPAANNFIWSVKSTGAAHRPLYAIIAFSKDKKSNLQKNLFQTDPIPNLSSYRLYINSEAYPAQEPYVKYSNGAIAELYRNYLSFFKSYTMNNQAAPLLDRATFEKHPLICIDCSRSESSPGALASDITLEITSEKPFDDKMSCMLLLIHQNSMSYTPLSGVVQ